MANEEKGRGFVQRDGDKITFDLSELRRWTFAGKRVAGILIEDIETAARRVVEYAESVRERAAQPAEPAKEPTPAEPSGPETTSSPPEGNR